MQASQSHHSNTTQVPPPCQLNLPVGVLQTADTSLHVSELGSPRQDLLKPDTLSQSISYLNISSRPLPDQQNSLSHILQPNTSLSQPGTSLKQPDTSLSQPDIPLKQTDTSLSQPVTSLKQPDTSMSQLFQALASLPRLGTPDQKVSQTVTPQQQLLSRNSSETGKHDSEKDEHSADTLTDEHDSENDEVNKGTDLNDNLPPKPSSYSLTKSSQDAEASDSDSSHSDSNKSTLSQTSLTDPESLCNNCHKQPEYDDIDMDLPPPIHEPSFIHECPSPWLHYGYCTACLEVARFESSQRGQGNAILEHIAQCPGLLNQCFTGFHEEHIEMYTERENEIALKSHRGVTN